MGPGEALILPRARFNQTWHRNRAAGNLMSPGKFLLAVEYASEKPEKIQPPEDLWTGRVWSNAVEFEYAGR